LIRFCKDWFWLTSSLIRFCRELFWFSSSFRDLNSTPQVRVEVFP
jgi:hypothetical protein